MVEHVYQHAVHVMQPDKIACPFVGHGHKTASSGPASVPRLSFEPPEAQDNTRLRQSLLALQTSSLRSVLPMLSSSHLTMPAHVALGGGGAVERAKRKVSKTPYESSQHAVETLRRPGGRSDVARIKIHYNYEEKVQEYATHWDANSASPRIAFWLRQVRPGDVIELVPKAHFQAWLNIVLGASIEIEYQTRSAVDDALLSFGSLDVSSETPTARIVYQRLRSEDQQIRVLVIEPGSADDHVHVKFECVSLTEPPLDGTNGYHALSYYWGPSSETIPISIDTEGQTNRVEVGVSQTLHRTICRLRHTKEPLRI